MCGFVVASAQSADDLLDTESRVDLLTHRGPDEQGSWHHDRLNVEMSQCRLSVIDPPGGKQPMHRGSVRIVYNGELYNFQSLRQKLSSRYDFRTDSDTEVFLQGYREWGPGVFERARGMFSVVLWDDDDRTLTLARDPVGQKPLLYFSNDNKFMAASELQALAGKDAIPGKADPASLSWYLSLGYVPSPRTGFFNVKKVPPGHYMTVKENTIQKQVRYWDPVALSKQAPIDESDRVERIRTSLKTAVKRRLVSDVPLGAFLSGGIDSTLIVGLMSELRDTPIKTISVGFEDDAYDERSFARRAASAFGTEHEESTVNTDLRELLPKLVRHYGEPYADSSAVPTYYVAREAGKHVTVVLSGDGGDEAFGGYRRYRAFRYFSRVRRFLPRILRHGLQACARPFGLPSEKQSRWGEVLRVLKVIGESPVKQYLAMVGLGFDQLKAQLARGALKKPSRRGGEQWLDRWFKRFDHHENDPPQQAMLVDVMSYLPEDLLVKTDIATMMNSIECRSPFLDRDLLELSFRIPGRDKINGRNHKACLKEAFPDLIPASIRNRSKMGFGVPLAKWFRNGDRAEYLRNRLLEPHAAFDRLIDRSATEQLLEAHRSGTSDAAELLWALVFMKEWMREFGVTA